MKLLKYNCLSNKLPCTLQNKAPVCSHAGRLPLRPRSPPRAVLCVLRPPLSPPAYDMWPQCPLPAFILNSNQGCRLCSAGYSIHVNIDGCISLAHHIKPSPFTKASGWPAPCHLAGLATASSCCWLAHCIHAGDQRIIIDKQVVPRAVPRNGRGRLHRRILDRG